MPTGARATKSVKPSARALALATKLGALAREDMTKALAFLAALDVSVLDDTDDTLKHALFDLIAIARVVNQHRKYRSDQARDARGRFVDEGKGRGKGSGGKLQQRISDAAGKVKDPETAKVAAGEVKRVTGAARRTILGRIGDWWNALDDDTRHEIQLFVVQAAIVAGILAYLLSGNLPRPEWAKWLPIIPPDLDWLFRKGLVKGYPEYDPGQPRDEGGRFSGGQGGAGGRDRMPNSDDEITDAFIASLPDSIKTEEAAERAFKTKLLEMARKGELVLYHETPGDVKASIERKGLLGGWSASVFASIGKPSDFVTSDVKTVTAFTVPVITDLYPDAQYGWSEKLGIHQLLLLDYPDDLVGAYVSTAEESIPRAWIKSVTVVRKALAKGYPEYDPGQPRDDHGRWTDGSGGGSGESLHDLMRESVAAVDRAEARVREALAQENTKLVVTRGKVTRVLTKVPGGDAYFRITYFVDGEPLSHSDYRSNDSDIRQAASEMREDSKPKAVNWKEYGFESVKEWWAVDGIDVNTALRAGRDVADVFGADKISELDALVQSGTAANDMTVWRAVSSEFGDKLAAMQLADRVTDPGYTAAAPDKDEALRYITGFDGARLPGSALMRIDAPRGTRFGAMGKYEILFPRGSAFELVGRDGDEFHFRVVRK